MGKLRDEKRALRFSKGKGGDEDDFKAAKPKPKHTKHSIFEDGATKLKPGALAAGASDAGKGKRSASANVGQGPKRARDDETSADARGGYAEPKPGTGGRKAAGRARLAAAGPGGKGAPAAAPREKKALVRAVLPLWEELRDSKTSGEARIKLVADVLATLDETLLNVCVKHDAARVVQCCYKFGTEPQRALIAAKCIAPASLLDLARSHYGHKVLLAILRNGDKGHRQAVCVAVASHAAALAVHKEGALVLNAAQTAATDKATRLQMYRSLWGREFALFGAVAAAGAESAAQLVAADAARADALRAAAAAAKQTGGGGAKGSTAAAPTNIGEEPLAAAAAAATRRAGVIYALTELTLRASDKGTLSACGLAQRAAAEALLLSGARSRAELAAAVLPAAIDILHTPAGALASARALAVGSAKERKLFCRSLKGLVGKAARELYGAAVLIALTDVTDDTVLVGKTLLSELAADEGGLGDIAAHAHAHRLLLALCLPPLPPPPLAHAATRTVTTPKAAHANTQGGSGGAARAADATADLSVAAGGGDFADAWLAQRLPNGLRPVAQARLELAALAATLPPPPVYAPLAVEKDKPGAAAKRAKAAAATAADNDADADGANGGAAVLAADETEAALAAAVSKKPAALRRAELRRATRGPLLAAIAAEPERFATDRFASAVAESALAALHRSHCGPDKGGDGGGGKVRAVGGGVGADGADAVWDAAADALLDVAFEPVALGGAPGGATAAAAGKPSKKAKKTEAADGAPSARPRFASDVSAGRVLKRLVQTPGAVGEAFASRVLQRLSALALPMADGVTCALHGGAWVWLALVEAPATAKAARKALAPLLPQLGAAGAPPGCGALARALAV